MRGRVTPGSLLAGMRGPCVVALMLFACRAEENFTTPLAARIPLLDGVSCIPDTGYTTFVLELFRFEGPTDDRAPPTGTRCAYCARGDEECVLLQRTCRCAGPRITPDDVEQAMRGMRFEDLQPDEPLCVRLVAIEGEHVAPATGPGNDCACPDATGMRDADLCALSNVGSVNESGAPLQLTQLICGDPTPRPDGGTLDCDMLRERCEATRLSRWCDPLAMLCDAYVGPSLTQCATFGLP